MNVYVKSLSRRTEGDAREKQTAISYLGSTMTKHGEDFEDQSPFGACLMSTTPPLYTAVAVFRELIPLAGFGQANERLARVQDTYASEATTSWLDASERSLAQMKDYQVRPAPQAPVYAETDAPRRMLGRGLIPVAWPTTPP